MPPAPSVSRMQPQAPRTAWKRTLDLMAERVGRALPAVSELAAERRDPFDVLVSTVISLRTKDVVTGPASRRLLARAPTVAELAELPEPEIASLIYPAGFYNTKARQLRAVAATLLSDHDGAVPASLAALLRLPGVGRKTANLVLGAVVRHRCDLRGHPRAPHLQPPGLGRHARARRHRAGARAGAAETLLDTDQRHHGGLRPAGVHAAEPALLRVPGTPPVRAPRGDAPALNRPAHYPTRARTVSPSAVR